MRLKYVTLLSLLIIILSVSFVSANENITDDIAQMEDSESLESTVEGNKFADIQNAIDNAEENEVINLNGTYTSSGSEIKIDKNIELRGGSNGAILDAKKLSGIIIPSKKNYKITLSNLNFINAKNSVFFDTGENLFYNRGSLIINNCNFTDNEGVEFGAVLCYNVTITNSNFINNNAAGLLIRERYVSDGGAIESIYCNATNCNFENNKAMQAGGAIDSLYVDILNCSFKQNEAQESGGAIVCSYLNIVNSNFTSNSAKESSGGAICAFTYGNPHIDNCIFKENTAGFRGGAIMGVVCVENSLFEKNIATYGGAIHGYSYEGITVNNCTFKSNNEAAIISCGAKINNQSYRGGLILDDSLKSISLIKINVKEFSTTYRSGKTLKIKLTTSMSNKPAKYLEIEVHVYCNNEDVSAKILNYNYYYVTDKNGEFTIDVSKWPVGKYAIELEDVCLDDDEYYIICPLPKTTINTKISKAKTIVKAPKVTAKYKKSKYFKVTVKNKATKKAVKKLKLKVKVYTGKKYKTYTIKTNKKGVAKLNTKKLNRGKHKVKITSKNKNYKISKKSKIKIK
ncbi:hypothetical protein [Methanobrevibacter sp.]|uniref:hypothetical protein n=1 Tax=Methanobrevibacter sp. TaxID=66852 RepID=UPI0025D6BFFC|nr:hypothetical protein [Methanobrevibacter sp.]MBR4446964.1 hypothetical protein [Methanobrevibacter sp.]